MFLYAFESWCSRRRRKLLWCLIFFLRSVQLFWFGFCFCSCFANNDDGTLILCFRFSHVFIKICFLTFSQSWVLTALSRPAGSSVQTLLAGRRHNLSADVPDSVEGDSAVGRILFHVWDQRYSCCVTNYTLNFVLEGPIETSPNEMVRLNFPRWTRQRLYLGN